MTELLPAAWVWAGFCCSVLGWAIVYTDTPLPRIAHAAAFGIFGGVLLTALAEVPALCPLLEPYSLLWYLNYCWL